ncbi:hypothetical protein GGF37_001519 [Kickxella alabastrina]|nr:hypothetical protein GGF37_001519 [Kickxella alabastrina]
MSSHTQEDSKKPIYDSHLREYPAIPATQSPSHLSLILGQLRHTTRDLAAQTQHYGQLLVNHWILVEQKIAQTVSNTVPQGEKLAPGIIYVGVAALAGPIFTRKRNFAVRWCSPFVFGGLAAGYFLPGTAQVVLRNVWGRYGDPKSIDQVAATWENVRRKEAEVKRSLAGSVQELRLSLQEGRGFGRAKDQEQQQQQQKTASVRSVVGAVRDAEAVVAEKALAVVQKIDGVVAEKVEQSKKSLEESKKAFEESEKAGSNAANTALKENEKAQQQQQKQLPLGFKSNVDN